MTRQVDGQDREAAIGEEGGQGPPSVQVSSLTVHEQGPTITLSRTQAAQRECAGPGKLDRQNANVIHACRLDPQTPTCSRSSAVRPGCLGAQKHGRRPKLRPRCLQVQLARSAPET